MQKIVLLYSGGLDSTVLLHELKTSFEIHALSINYGQRHSRELDSAEKICSNVGVQLYRYELPPLKEILRSGCLTGVKDVPEGHYEDSLMKETVVPNRNAILLMMAAGFAISRGINGVAYAAHRGDRAVYPDCRPEFVWAAEEVLKNCHYTPIQLKAPYLNLTKSEIVRRGEGLNVPFAETWSCYKGAEWHCGKCGTCFERREAFTLAGVVDPTRYESL